MPWLRLDDKFPSHPKIAQLSDREFRAHVRVLCYCAEYRTDGQLSDVIWTEIVGLTRTMGDKFVRLGLWDRDRRTGRLSVHDFAAYNPKDPTGAERQARHRAKARNGDVTEDVAASRVGAGARPVPSPWSDAPSVTPKGEAEAAADSPAGSAKGSAAGRLDDQKIEYRAELGEALVRNGAWDDPHLTATLTERFAGIPPAELMRLKGLAESIAEEQRA